MLAMDAPADEHDVKFVKQLIEKHCAGACSTLVASRQWFFNYAGQDEMDERYDQWRQFFVALVNERPLVLKTSIWQALETLYKKKTFPLSNYKNDGYACKQLLVNLVHKERVCTNGLRQSAVVKEMLSEIRSSQTGFGAAAPAPDPATRRRLSRKSPSGSIFSSQGQSEHLESRVTPQASLGQILPRSGPTANEKNEQGNVEK